MKHPSPLPSSPEMLPASGIALLEETMRRNRVLFAGYQEILACLALNERVDKKDIQNIIAAIMDKIS